MMSIQFSSAAVTTNQFLWHDGSTRSSNNKLSTDLCFFVRMAPVRALLSSSEGSNSDTPVDVNMVLHILVNLAHLRGTIVYKWAWKTYDLIYGHAERCGGVYRSCWENELGECMMFCSVKIGSVFVLWKMCFRVVVCRSWRRLVGFGETRTQRTCLNNIKEKIVSLYNGGNTSQWVIWLWRQGMYMRNKGRRHMWWSYACQEISISTLYLWIVYCSRTDCWWRQHNIGNLIKIIPPKSEFKIWI